MPAGVSWVWDNDVDLVRYNAAQVCTIYVCVCLYMCEHGEYVCVYLYVYVFICLPPQPSLTLIYPSLPHIVHYNNVTQVYLRAYYWAAYTVITVGYGSISLVTNSERILAMAAMTIGE